ncbi:MAG TPA: DUF1573 domain-containing protein [Candidatus Kapabacteria bacterium]|jgi:hypothetical protein
MRTRIVISVLIAAIIGLCSYAATYMMGSIRSVYREAENTVPLSLEAEVDLGPVETGQTATARFPVFNRSHMPVKIRQVRTECGCLGVFLLRNDGSHSGIVGTQIQAESEITVEVRFLVRGETGESIRQNFYLITDSAQQPEVQVTCKATPSGRVAAIPNSITVGSMLPKGIIRREIEIRDDRRLGGFPIDRIVSSNPQCVLARLINVERDITASSMANAPTIACQKPEFARFLAKKREH